MNTRTIVSYLSKTLAVTAFATALLLALPASAQLLHSSSEDGSVIGQHRVELNSASEEELMSLPGIGPALAKRIIEERTARPFESTSDLERVKGIGPASLKRLLPHVRVQRPARRS